MMKKRKLLLLPLALVIYSANAQKVTPHVINTTGNTLSNNTITVEYSIGEIAITTLKSDTSYITQGLLQPSKAKLITGFETIANNRGNVTFYPNPVVNNFVVSCPQGFSANIYNVEGVNLGQVATNQEIDASDLNTGMYIIKIVDDKNQTSNSFKFIKL
jgi:hypothetical protein